MLSAFLRLLLLIAGGFILSQLIAAGIVLSAGGDLSSEGMAALSATAMKSILLASHLFTFIAPCFLFIYLNYKERKWQILHLDKPIDFSLLLICMLFVIVSYPAVTYSYTVNSWIPLADWMINQESSTTATLEKILEMKNINVFLFNVLLIAIIPGIGEELLFRGLIQDFIEKSSKNIHIAVWTAALAFSAFHLQFQGFLPRLLLGALMGYSFVFTRNLWVPIILHILNNMIPIVTLYFFGSDVAAIDPNDTQEIHWSAGLISLALGIGVALFLYKKTKLNEFTKT